MAVGLGGGRIFEKVGERGRGKRKKKKKVFILFNEYYNWVKN